MDAHWKRREMDENTKAPLPVAHLDHSHESELASVQKEEQRNWQVITCSAVQPD